MNKGQVVIGLSLPSDQQPAEPVVPAIGPLDHPPSRLTTNSANKRRLSTSSRVADDAASAQSDIDALVVVALVQAAMDRACPLRCSTGRIVDCAQCHPHIGHVRAAEDDANRDPLGVREEMPFGTALGPVRGVSARELPPFGALTITPSSAVQSQSRPTWSS
jgi:hypothetical protein